MLRSPDDTIAAISTPPGEGGIGIVRLSGKDAVAIARRVFRSKTGRVEVELLLKGLENMESRLPEDERFDTARIRAELELPS